MKPEDIIVIIIVAVIVALAVLYVYRAKKRGATCIGCPHSGKCPTGRAGRCTCRTTEKHVSECECKKDEKKPFIALSEKIEQ